MMKLPESAIWRICRPAQIPRLGWVDINDDQQIHCLICFIEMLNLDFGRYGILCHSSANVQP
jgi:hypothetical protein